MSADLFSAPSDLVVDAPEEVFDRNGVRRSKDGRPYVKVHCGGCDGGGRVPGVRAGTTKNCPTCKGKGNAKEVVYTRCTSFVGVLESRQNLEAWQRRITLLGLAVDGTLWADLLACDPDDRDAIDRIADRAFEIGDGHAAAQKGTDLHLLSEAVDEGGPFAIPASLADRVDMAAYARARDRHRLRFTDAEVFVVQDDLKIGGTFDRRAIWPDHHTVCSCPAEAVIFDLKTGRVDYGQGKICQQLGVYAHSQRYDPETGDRRPLDVCQKYGLVLHLAQGTGEARLLTADLVEGWRAVQISADVRAHRRESKGWLMDLDDSKLISKKP
jgi:hypothetical protein